MMFPPAATWTRAVGLRGQIIIIEITSLVLKYNRIGVIVLIRLYFYFLAIVIENTQF